MNDLLEYFENSLQMAMLPICFASPISTPPIVRIAGWAGTKTYQCDTRAALIKPFLYDYFENDTSRVKKHVFKIKNGEYAPSYFERDKWWVGHWLNYDEYMLDVYVEYDRRIY